MKTFFEKTALCLIALLMLCPAGLSAQKNGKDADISKYLAGAVPVENGVVVFRKSYKAEGKTKEQLYVLLNYWFTATFNDANSVIKLNDKELGTIIAQGFVESIAQHAGGTNAYNVNLRPVIKCDIKDNKVRVTYTVPFYSVNVAVGGGWMGAMGGTIPTRSDQNWTLDKCYPFAKKDSHKKTSCKALVMAHAYSNVVMDKIEECIKNGVSGNENDNW